MKSKILYALLETMIPPKDTLIDKDEHNKKLQQATSFVLKELQLSTFIIKLAVTCHLYLLYCLSGFTFYKKSTTRREKIHQRWMRTPYAKQVFRVILSLGLLRYYDT